MPRGIPTTPEIKELIFKRVKNGERVDDLANEFKIYPNTIRKWLAQEGLSGSFISSNGNLRNNRSSALLLAKAERDKQDLLKIIGELVVINKELSKKKDRPSTQSNN
jgi:transposase-like protein